MIPRGHTVGIWGFGKVGKAAAIFLKRQGYKIIIMDKKTLPLSEENWAKEHEISIYGQQDAEHFFSQADTILASPGIDTKKERVAWQKNWVTELDLFYNAWKNKIAAVTGSVGKTTVTHILGQLIQIYEKNVCVGGNIGTPALSLVQENQKSEIALLEVSSFQLEYVKSFSPDLAIWTNLVPNHFDRHTQDEYFSAKCNVLFHQKMHQLTIIPWELEKKVRAHIGTKRKLILFSDDKKQNEKHNQHNIHFYQDNGTLYKRTHTKTKPLIKLSTLPDITFGINWILICAAIDTLGYDLSKITAYAPLITIPEHRMERINAKSIVFYNDSKSTTPASTLAGINKLCDKRVTLFLGGLSKGIDRGEFIAQLPTKVEKVYCFGAEKEALYDMCVGAGLKVEKYADLDAAFSACIKKAAPQDTILFSPSGSSYDLYTDYQERGNHFKRLVSSIKEGSEDLLK